MRALLRIFYCLLCLQSPALADCFQQLSRTPATNYQPVPICPPNQIFNCFSSPPLVLIFDFPRETFTSYLDPSVTSSRYSSRLRQLVQASLKNTAYFKYVCRSQPLKPFNLYDCFVSSDATSPVFSSVAFFNAGLPFPSRSSYSFFYKYRPDSFPDYYAEYNCHPQNSDHIQLRQYHWGPTKKEYINNNSVLLSNYTGGISLVLKISTLDKDAFVQKKTRKSIGFSIDPSAPQILYQNLVPDRLK